MPLLQGKNIVQKITNKLIEDHLRYSCAEEAYVRWMKVIHSPSYIVDDSIVNEMVQRKKIINLIRDRKTDEAYIIIQEDELLDQSKFDCENVVNDVIHLAFVDIVNRGDLKKSVEFGKKYFPRKKNFEDVIRIIGFKDINENIVDDVSKRLDRSQIIDSVNSFLFYSQTNRKCSLLHSATSYQEILTSLDK